MKTRNISIVFILLFIVLFLASCAPIGETSKEYGFFAGIIHGLVFIPAFALNFIVHIVGGHTNFAVYAMTNTGFFYWLGYVIGVVISLLVTGTGGIIGLSGGKD